MKLTKLLFVTILAFAIGACGGESTKQKNVDDKKDGVTTDTKAEKGEKDTADSGDDSPTKAVEDFAKAYDAKNVTAMKKRFSKSSLEMMEKGAKLQKKDLDEMLKETVAEGGLPFKGMPKMKNEKIDGDNATIDIETDGEWDTMPLVKEDGMWKIAFDKTKE